jgi:hypothetical protein
MDWNQWGLICLLAGGWLMSCELRDIRKHLMKEFRDLNDRLDELEHEIIPDREAPHY